ncbi:membrane protein insertion efficiency factor YidD [Photobacterium jeanii]|uniref:membrane protein insertion efficiency factor YidD n=1 Tax=Photobacterium jeanii TaxID=858640 RepID=UPI000A01C238|nr:membrane protein insertion efficiency factor YidD [Photobacterium jeanii]
MSLEGALNTERFISHIAIWGIKAYQRCISPYKGFCCAHASLHKGDSCSQAVLNIIAAQGVIGGRVAIKTRFHHCHLAHQSLVQMNANKKNRPKRRKRDQIDCCDLPLSTHCDCDFISSCDSLDLPCECSLHSISQKVRSVLHRKTKVR